MKKVNHYLVLVLVVTMLVSSIGVSAYAANVDDYPFYNFTMRIWQRYLNPRVKEDVSPCYLYITEATNENGIIHVSANGCNADGDNKENCTWNALGNLVSTVKVWYGQDFSIRNIIYEQGYTYSTLGFSISAFQDNEISGVWSPDTGYSHQIATN